MSGGGRKRALHHEGDVDHVRVGEEDSSMKKETRFFMKNGTRARAGEEERAEAGARAAADGVEAEDALEAGAVVGELADAVEHEVDDLLADGVVAAGVELSRPLRNGSGVCTARFGDTVTDEATFLRGGVESTPDMWTTPRFMTSVTSPCCGRT